MESLKSKTETESATLRDTVLETCRDIARDKHAPAAARVQAARTLAEMAGMLGKIQTNAVDTGETRDSEMTPDDIDRELARLSQSAALRQ